MLISIPSRIRSKQPSGPNERVMRAIEPHTRDHRREKYPNSFGGTQAELKARMLTRIKKCTLHNTRKEILSSKNIFNQDT